MSPALAGGFFTTSTTWEVPLTPTHAKYHFISLPVFSHLIFLSNQAEMDYSTNKTSILTSYSTGYFICIL